MFSSGKREVIRRKMAVCTSEEPRIWEVQLGGGPPPSRACGVFLSERGEEVVESRCMRGSGSGSQLSWYVTAFGREIREALELTRSKGALLVGMMRGTCMVVTELAAVGPVCTV